MNEVEFLRLWIKEGIGSDLINQGKINGKMKERGFPWYVAYTVEGNVFLEEWPHPAPKPKGD